jgi:non-ribosomal peptide synthetase component F
MALSGIASGAGEISTADANGLADIGGLLAFHARTTPAAPALLAPGRPPLTYGALGATIEHLLRTLRGLGIAPADRVAVALPRGADSALALIAVASSCACVPLNPDLTADELQRYFSEMKLTALVTRGARYRGDRLRARTGSGSRRLRILRPAGRSGLQERRCTRRG